MELFGYWRSSSTYRLRIGLNLKGVAYETRLVNLLKDGGEQHRPEYAAVNPARRVPTLRLDDGTTITQSMAALEYLDEVHPEPAFLPGDAARRALIRAAALQLACDAQPLQNNAVLKVVRDDFGQGEDGLRAWVDMWVGKALRAVEALADAQGPYLFGDAPTLADVVLAPQLYNARRFQVDLSGLTRVVEADQAARAHPAFIAAAPERQPDAPVAA